MSVAVAHQVSATARLILQEAAKEARLRQTSLSVIYVAEGVDIDLLEEQKVNRRAEIAEILGEVKLDDVEWTLQVATGVDVADTVIDLIADTDVELLVIGARRRTPVGKLIMGSVTQNIILRAEVAVEEAVEFGTQKYGDGFYLRVKPHQEDAVTNGVASSNGHSPQTHTDADAGSDAGAHHPAGEHAAAVGSSGSARATDQG